MPNIGDITSIKVNEEFHTCPSCGYDLGFHTSFISMNASKDTPVKSTRNVLRVILICPECGARFDVGWRVTFTEFESRFVKTIGMPNV
jgi:transcription elongation factor Elf1